MSISIVGKGLHSGGQVEVLLTEMPAGYGVHWYVAGDIKVFLKDTLGQEHSLAAPRTTLVSRSGSSLRMPEHLMAALLGWHGVNLRIDVLQGELPILDGSSLPWKNALKSLFGTPSSPVFYDCLLQDRFEFEHGFWESRPSLGDFFELDLSLDQHGYQDRIALRIQDWSDLETVLQARTFIFERDFHSARAMGMLSGAQEGSGIVVAVEEGRIQVIHGEPLRHTHELCLHKALDLCGDLALLGLQLPKLNIRIHNGGHWAHHHLIQRIQSLCP